jgi:hypothetical protein
MPFKYKDRIDEYQKEYRTLHREKLRQKSSNYYYSNKESLKAKRRESDYSPEGRLRVLLWSAKSRATKFGLEFNITSEDLHIPEYCPILGIKLNFSAGKGNDPDRASLDRIDNSKGYTKENTRIISLRANVLKRDGTLKELEAIVKYMKKYVEEQKS